MLNSLKPSSPRIAIGLAVWVTVVTVGWLTRSIWLTVLAPLILLVMFVLEGVRVSASGRSDPFEPVWLIGALFAFAYLLVPALMVVEPTSFVSLPGYEDLPPAQFRLACLVAALGFIGFLGGYRVAGSRRSTGVSIDRSNYAIRSRVALGLASTLFLVGSVSVAIAVHDSGVAITPGSLFSGRMRQGVVAHFSGRGFLTVGFMLLMLAPPVLTVWAAELKRRQGWWILAAVAGISAIELAALAGSRIGVLAIVVGCLVAVHNRARRIPWKILLIAVLALAAVGIVQSAVRGTAHLNNLLSPLGTLSATLDGFGQLVNALARVRSFQFGRTLVEDLGITYVPRALWHHKPVIYGFVRAQQQVMPGLFNDFRSGSATFPVGLVAEGYVNFAVFGAVGLPFAAGALLRRLYVAVRRSGSDWALLVLAWTLGNAVSLLRGFATTLLTVVIGAAFLSPMLLAERLARRKVRRVTPPSPEHGTGGKTPPGRAATEANARG